MNIKNCKFCSSNKIKKNGKRGNNQRYICKICGKSWVLGKSKKTKEIDPEKLFKEYVNNDLKYRQISMSLNLSKRSIQYILNKAPFKKIIVI